MADEPERDESKEDNTQTEDRRDHRSPVRVREVYDRIASHFSKTRAYPWPEVEAFLDDSRAQLVDRRIGVDIGCGNGRHTHPLAETVEYAVGIDLSRALLQEADEQGSALALVQGDAASLPFRDGCADVVVYVATLHHLPDRETRIESLREVGRILGPGGRGLVSAWSTEHDRFSSTARDDAGFDTTIDWTLPGGETVPRFYHIYGPTEFERDLRAAGLTVESSVVSSGNCYAEVRPSKTG